MNDESKAPSTGITEHIERVKLDYVESTISLAESFARKVAQYAQQGDIESALKARSTLESFCRSALEMVQKLRAPQAGEVFLQRLRLLGCDPEGSNQEFENRPCSN